MSNDIRQILVGVDFDAASEAVVTLAGALAEALHAQMAVLHAAATNMPAYFTTEQVGELEAERRQAQATLATELRAFAAHYTRVPLTVLTGEGPPADAILRQASGFDLIVLGTNRLGGLRRWWLGSVAEAVVRATRVPVLVVPAGRPTSRDDFARMVVIGARSDCVDAVVASLQSALALTVTRAPSLAECTPDRLRGADLVVVPFGGSSGVGLEAAIDALKECSHPLLFVPAAAGVREGDRHDC